MKKFCFILICSCLTGFAGNAQQATSGITEKSSALRLVPQQFIAKTFQLDFETAISPTASLQFSPSVTAGDEVLGNEYKNIIGGGLEVTSKFYVGYREKKLEGFYAGISGSYHIYNMDEPEFVFLDQSGNQIIIPGPNVNINRLAANVIFGHQFIIQDVVAIDVFVGGGLRVGNADKEPNDRFSRPDIFDFAYTGVAPKLGLSIGILF